jgi:hypothetical protein
MTLKKVAARFYLTPAGANPVRDWLIELPADDRRQLGHDIGVVEYGWPVGMPLGPLGDPTADLALARKRQKELERWATAKIRGSDRYSRTG